MSPGPRRKRGAFSLPAVRRNEIERHARYVGAADTGDFWRWLVAWRWHNGQNSRDPAGAVKLAAERMGGSLSDGEADAILETADALRQRRTADKLARFLGVTFPQRRALGITTIGSIDITKGTRTLLRKRKKRRYNEQRRRAQGVRPRTEYEESSLTRTKPWEAEGMSRRTWYRKRRGTSPNPATHGTSPNPALLSSGVPAPVPRQRRQGLSEGAIALRAWCFSLGAGLLRETKRVAAATTDCCPGTYAKKRRRDYEQGRGGAHQRHGK
jgi:hypothetical protein